MNSRRLQKLSHNEQSRTQWVREIASAEDWKKSTNFRWTWSFWKKCMSLNQVLSFTQFRLPYQKKPRTLRKSLYPLQEYYLRGPSKTDLKNPKKKSLKNQKKMSKRENWKKRNRRYSFKNHLSCFSLFWRKSFIKPLMKTQLTIFSTRLRYLTFSLSFFFLTVKESLRWLQESGEDIGELLTKRISLVYSQSGLWFLSLLCCFIHYFNLFSCSSYSNLKPESESSEEVIPYRPQIEYEPPEDLQIKVCFISWLKETKLRKRGFIYK